ncbi:ATP-binding cassette domain-containing protein [Niameybacter massiliensis]|uniref:ATP-binding cassette domain-containing protein n=1 Tax=Niameybacter massiliensis TaxID=1658108 RepID=UPI0006B4C7CD|nr:ATP-binding cassette domain-containing protein [Niameybacter massiliensis]
MIELSNVTFSYEAKRVLGPLSLSIQAGSTCALIGPSGCGKTTLLHLLAGLLTPTEGTIQVAQQPLIAPRAQTSVILQNLGLLPWKTVYDNVALALINSKLSKVQLQDKILPLLDTLGLKEYSSKYPHQLSGGQKQRVAIARTLITNPDVLLLDEATSALDEITKEKLQHLILDIYHQNPMTLVFVTHSIEEAVFLGQTIVIMNNGHISHTLSNPLFGCNDAKEHLDFYKQCLEIRKLLKEDQAL